MKKLIKITAAVVVSIFALGFAVILYLLTLNPNNHKEWIAGKFQDSTGHSLVLGGEIGLTLYPWLGISLNEVSVGNAPGFGDEPLFHADFAEVRIKLMPMLGGKYEIDTVKLHGAVINLAIDDSGRANWAGLAGGDSADTAATSEGLVLTNVVLGGVDVRELSLTLDDRAAGARHEVRDFTFSTGELVFGDPIDIAMNFAASSTNPALGAQVALEGTVSYDLRANAYEISPLDLRATLSGANVPNGSADISLQTGIAVNFNADTLSIPSLTLDALGTSAQASISGSNVSTAMPAYQAEVDLRGSDLALLFRIAEIEPLATQIATLTNRAFEFSASVDADMRRGNVTLDGLQARLLGADISGNIDASNVQSDTPAVRGQLTASGPDLPTLIEVIGQIQGGRNSDLSQMGRQLAQIPDKNFSVNAQFDANMQNGNVNVPTLDLRLLGATIQGNLTASNAHTDTPQVRGTLNASGPDLPLLMQIAGQIEGGADSALNQMGRQLRTGVNNRSFNINSQFDANMQNGNIDVPVLSAEMLGLRLNGSLNTRNIQNSTGTVTGNLSLTGNNLRPVLTALEQAELGEVLQSINLSVGLGGTRGDLAINPFNLDAVFAGSNIPNSPVTVALRADSRLNLDRETLAMDSFTLTGMGLNVSGKVNASGILDTPDFNGELNVASFNLRRLMQQLNQELPPTADNRVFQNVAISTSFAGSGNHMDISNLALVLDDSNIQGRFSLRDFERPNIDFAIDIDAIDADRYLAPETQDTAADEAATEIPVETLRNLALKGELNIGRLTISQLRMSDLGLAMNAGNGLLNLSPRANLYDGNISGTITLDASGDSAVANIQTNLASINLGPLLQDFLDAELVSGRGNVELAINGRGNDTDAIKRTLAGSGRVNLQDGVLHGVDIGDVLAQVEAMIRNRRVAELQRGERTAFSNFSTSLDIRDGVVSTQDLAITAPGFRVTGRGTLANLSNDTLNFSLTAITDPATATRQSEQYENLRGYSLPIACTGALDSPTCLPDAGEILRVAVSNVLEQQVGNLLNRALGGDRGQQQAPQEEQEEGQQQQQPQEPADAATELLNRAFDRLRR